MVPASVLSQRYSNDACTSGVSEKMTLPYAERFCRRGSVNRRLPRTLSTTHARRERHAVGRKQLQLAPSAGARRIEPRRAAERIGVVAGEELAGHADHVAPRGEVDGGRPAVRQIVAAPLPAGVSRIPRCRPAAAPPLRPWCMPRAPARRDGESARRRAPAARTDSLAGEIAADRRDDAGRRAQTRRRARARRAPAARGDRGCPSGTAAETQTPPATSDRAAPA